MKPYSKSYQYINNSFHRDVEILYEDRVPQQGPVLFYMNHSQFMADAHAFTLFKNKVAVAISSVMFKKPFFRLYNYFNIDVTTVDRPIDLAYNIPGTIIKITKDKIIGKETKFTKLKQGQIILLKTTEEFKINKIMNDTQISIKNTKNLELQNISEFKVIPIMNFSTFFDDVIKRMKNKQYMIISSQGRSHDLQQMMPMKAGLANIVFGAWQKHGIKIQLVPVVAHAHKQHQYRSQFFFEVGHPFSLTNDLLQIFEKQPKKAIQIMATMINKNIKCFKPQLKGQTTQKKAINLRRLSAVANQDFKQKKRQQKLIIAKRMADLTNKIYDQKQKDFQTYSRFQEFNKFLNENKIDLLELNRQNYKDFNFIKLIYYTIKVLMKFIMSLPGVLLYGPSALVAKLLAYKKHKEYSEARKWVQVPGTHTDIIGSYKVMYFCLFAPLNTLVNLVAGFKGLQATQKFKQNEIFKILGASSFLIPLYHQLFKYAYDSMGKDYKHLRHIFIKMFHKKLINQIKIKQNQLIQRIKPSF